MKIYKTDYSVEVGEVVEVDYEDIKVLSIVKVSFKENTVWFTGVPTSEMY